MRSDFIGQRYEQALATLEKTDLPKTGRRSLLYKLEKAMIADRQQQHRESRALFLQADKISDDLFTKSISKSAASYVVNDTLADYELEDYEKVAIHAQLALSFLETKELQSARVAARKINSRLDEIHKRYRDQKPSKYGQDAFALYLSGLIYEAKGDWDDAIIDYKKAYALYNDKYSWFVPEVPKQLVKNYYALLRLRQRTTAAKKVEKDFPAITKQYQKSRNTGSLVALFEVKTIANKEAADHILPISGQVVRFSFPRIPYTSDGIGKTGLEVLASKESDGFYKAEMIQNLNKVAYYNLEERRTRMALKATSRLIVKGVAVEAARRKYGAWGGLVANILSAATETADTRGWNLLPAYYYATRIELPPGKYKVRFFKDSDDAGEQEITVRPRQISFVRIK